MKGIPKSTPSFIGICYKCNKKGHKAYECKSKVKQPKKETYMDKYCPAFKMHGHTSLKCRKKKKQTWKPKDQETTYQLKRVGNQYVWDYNTWANSTACGRFGHIA